MVNDVYCVGTHLSCLGCGEIYTEMKGNIMSLNYPLDYVENLDCQYCIDLTSSGALAVTLNFLDFQTETFKDFVMYVSVTF